MNVTELWTWPTLIASFLWGLLFAIGLAVIAARPRFESRVRHSITLLAWLTFLVVAVLFIGQTIVNTAAAIWTGDEAWPRIVSRGLGPNVVCALGVGLGTGLMEWVRQRRHKRKDEAAPSNGVGEGNQL